MRLTLLFLTVLVAAAMPATAGERPDAVAAQRPGAVPLIRAHAQQCPVPPARAVLWPCVCDDQGKNCRLIFQRDDPVSQSQDRLASPWCQCPIREARDGR